MLRKTRRLTVVVMVLGMLALAGCFLFPNRPPVADFTVQYGTDTEKPLLVVFDASDSSDPDGDEIVDYMWTTTDDNATITGITPLDTTKTVHVPQIMIEFNVEDTYQVTLAVRDEQGKVSVPVSAEITVPHVTE